MQKTKEQSEQERSVRVGLRNRWWDAYLTALSAFGQNPSMAVSANASNLAKDAADAAIEAYAKKWPAE